MSHRDDLFITTTFTSTLDITHIARRIVASPQSAANPTTGTNSSVALKLRSIILVLVVEQKIF
jgi:hypothetical protein